MKGNDQKSHHSVGKSLKKSDFTTLRAERAEYISGLFLSIIELIAKDNFGWTALMWAQRLI